MEPLGLTVTRSAVAILESPATTVSSFLSSPLREEVDRVFAGTLTGHLVAAFVAVMVTDILSTIMDTVNRFDNVVAVDSIMDELMGGAEEGLLF